MDSVKAFGEGIVFQFIDSVRAGVFGRTTEAGIYIPPSHTESTETHEAIVVSVGERARHVTPGDQIIIENLQWTEEFKIGSKSYWKTDEAKVLAIRD